MHQELKKKKSRLGGQKKNSINKINEPFFQGSKLNQHILFFLSSQYIYPLSAPKNLSLLMCS
jgi:hypothetical protein